MHAIEIKGDNSISREDKFKEYAKVIYLNKEIVDISRKNIDDLPKSDIEELAIFKPTVENYMLFGFYEFLRLSGQSLFNIFFAKNNALLETKMQSYTLFTATELFTTSRDVISFLHHGRTENSPQKKFFNIIFLYEDYNFVIKTAGNEKGQSNENKHKN